MTDCQLILWFFNNTIFVYALFECPSLSVVIVIALLKTDDMEENEENVGGGTTDSESTRLGNILLGIQIESERLELEQKQDVNRMINEFLGNDNSK